MKIFRFTLPHGRKRHKPMNLRLFTSFFAVVCFCTTSSAVHANFISNGNFQGISPFVANPGSPVTIGGWTFSNHAGVEQSSGGNRYARLETNGDSSTDSTIAQTVTGLTIGSVYTLSWDLALRVNSSGSGTGRSFGVFRDSQIFANALKFDEYLSTTYKTDSVSFFATATSHKLIFAGELDSRSNGNLGTTDVSYNIDNIQLNASPVPEPATLTLFGLATVGLVGFRKRLAGRRRNQDHALA